jgi:hypothetical protein
MAPPEGERILCDWAAKEHGVDAIFVHGFLHKKRPLYAYPLDSHITMGFDCLFPRDRRRARKSSRRMPLTDRAL